jgi:hypothetical protein
LFLEDVPKFVDRGFCELLVPLAVQILRDRHLDAGDYLRFRADPSGFFPGAD